MSKDQPTDELAELMERFEAMFGESAPLMMLPSGEKEAAELLRRVLETGDQSLIDAEIPPGAVV